MMESSSGLLGLPRELRDKIYSHILSDQKEPPTGPSSAGTRISEGTLQHEPLAYLDYYCYRRLSMVSSQLRAEIQDYRSRFRKPENVNTIPRS